MQHQVLRVRHELKRRLTVREVGRVTPGMVRVVLADPALADFVSAGFDDHVKLFFPGEAEAEAERRDYTPRAFDTAAGTLTIDFVLHGAGPATRWAAGARPGDRLEIGGPRGSVVVSDSFDWWLLVGDETALPAIGRRIEEAAPGSRIVSLAAVTGPAEEQRFATRAELAAHWVHRPAAAAAEAAPLVAALAGLDWPAGDGLRLDRRRGRRRAGAPQPRPRAPRPPAPWLRASGYWQSGTADAHVKIED